MWSFAVLLWELVTREVPFADLSHMEIGMKVRWRHGRGKQRSMGASVPPTIFSIKKLKLSESYFMMGFK